MECRNIAVLIACWLSLVLVAGRNIDGTLGLIPSQCLNELFCFESYSEELQATVERVVKEHNISGLLYGDAPQPPFANRQGFKGNEEHICDVTIYEPTEKPTFLKDRSNRTRVVVQSSKFSQSIRMVKCKNPGRITQAPLELFDPSEKKIHCEQQYLQFKFLVLSADRQGVEFVDSLLGIPVCCNCIHYDFTK